MMEIENQGIDYIFSDIVGGSGFAQWKIVFFGFFLNAAGGVPLFIHMFAAYTPSHRCKVPSCESYGNSSWMEWALPSSMGTSNFLQVNGAYDSCRMFKMKDVSSACVPENFSNETIKCTEWVYDKTNYEYTISTKYNLVCDSESKEKLLGTLMMIGLMFGSMIGGSVGDYFGRKVSCYTSISITTCLLFLSSFVPSYEFYATFVLLMCICLPVHWICAHSILVEAFGVSGRESCIAVKDTFAPIYQSILGALAYFFKPYYQLHISVGTLGLIALSTAFFIPESVRWDSVNGNSERAKKNLFKFAKENGKTLTEFEEKKIKDILHKIYVEAKSSTNKGKHSFMDLFRNKELRISLVLIANWITVCFGAYTLSLNITNLYGNIFLNFVITGVVELPASIVIYIILKKFSRRFNLFLYQLITSTCCVSLAIIPKTWSLTILVVFLIGLLSAGGGFVMVWLLPMELYPTNLRAQALGTCSTIARFFSIGAGFLSILSYYWKPLPLLIIGVPGFFAGLSAYLLPETAGMNLNELYHKENKKVIDIPKI
ncbi:organic cation transporter-like protein [Lepeophtheirus salmonis]|uniref:organic cation transporter-like protein n=1 Tax=Lepeophtheirus salmonis TaxID=72036 RepID=UPI001AEAA921|nr:organic cation transporter-like protein [Lepeophtheirus salmonis]